MNQTYMELVETVKPLIHAHRLYVIVDKEEDGDYKIVFVDVTDMQIMDGTGETERTILTPFTLYAQEIAGGHEIGFIEHGFYAFTKANKEAVQQLVGIIGTCITDLDEVAPRCFKSTDEVKEAVKDIPNLLDA